METAEAIALINIILGVAFKIYESVSQVQGDTPIPTWDELLSQYTILQAKIDAESKT